MNTIIEDTRFREQTRLLLHNSRTAAIVNICIAFLTYLAIPSQSHVWLWLILGIAVIRCIFYFWFTRKSDRRDNLKEIYYLILILVALQGATWGIASIFLYNSATDFHRFYLMAIICGMTGGSVLTLAPSMLAFACFTLPAVFPLVFTLLTQSDKTFRHAGFMGVVFLLAVHILAKRICKSNSELIDSRSSLEVTTNELALHKYHLEVLVEERTKELADSRETYRRLTEEINDAIYELDSEGRITYISPVITAITGYQPEKITGLYFSDFVFPDDLSMLQEKFPKVLSGILEPSEFRIFDSVGNLRWVRTSSRPILSNDGPIGLRGILTDIEREKQAARYGELGREVLQILNEAGDLQNSIQHVLTVLKKGAVFDAVGIRLQEGEDFPYLAQEGFPPDFLLTENSLIERTADGGMCRNQDGMIRLECTCGQVISGRTDPTNPLFTPGGSFWTNDSFPLLDILANEDRRLKPPNQCIHQGYASIALVPIRNKERNVGLIQFNVRRNGYFTLEAVELLEGITSHIGAALMRKRAEEALQESHRQNQEILNSITDAFISLTNDMVVSYFNSAAEQMLNRKRIDVIGRNLLDVFPEVKGSIFEKKYAQAIRTKSPVSFEAEVTVAPYQNWYDVRVYPSRKGTTIYFQVITERKQTEEEKAKRESVNRQIQKTESLGRMAGAIAHHFNNKLHVVLGNLELAINRLPPGDTSITKLTSAMEAADQAAEVSRMMLTYLGQVTDERELLDLSEICRRNLPLLQVIMPKNVVFETDLQFPGTIINANANQIQQILTNLVTNAWEAAGDDRNTIHLTVKTVPTADISTSHRYPVNWQPADNSYACLEVRDNGCGIADQDLEEVFSPFFSTKFTGRGLGLSVVLGLVQAHGGGITVESSQGQESVFRVFFPLSTEEIVKQPHNETNALEIQETGTVLLIDDDRIVLEISGAMLSMLGFTVLSAMDGIEAVEVFRRHKDEIRFVLSDVAMPHMNGWETLLALRQLSPGIPVILASGYSEQQVMEGVHPEHPQAFLGKPYGFQALKDAILRTLKATKE